MIGDLLVLAFFLASMLFVCELLAMREDDYISARAYELRERDMIEWWGARPRRRGDR